jgi:hypothetical protein
MASKKNKRIAQLAKSFPEFVKHMEIDVKRYPSVPPHHLQIAHDLQHSGERFIALAAWRRAAKSELLHYYCCWRFLLQPQLEILVLSASRERAEKFSKQIVRLMRQSPYLQHLAPKGNQVLSSFYLNGVSKEWPSVQSVSIGTNFTGYRADLVIADDPLGAKIAQSFAKSREAIHALAEVNQVLRRPGGYYQIPDDKVPDWAMPQYVMAWTPHNFSPHNYYEPTPEMPEHIMRRCHQLTYPLVPDAVYDDSEMLIGGSSAWPEEFSWESIVSEQHLFPSKFALEKQLDASPRVDATSLVRFNKIISHDDDSHVPEHYCYIDPASGGLDEFAYCIAGVSEVKTILGEGDGQTKTVDRVIYVRELGGFKGDPEDAFVQVMKRCDQDPSLTFIYADDNRSEALYLSPLIEKNRKRYRYEPFKITGSHGSKESRLKLYIPGATNMGAIEMHTSILQDTTNYEQLSGLRDGFGLPKHDDRLDAMCYAIQDLGRQTSFSQNIEKYGQILGNIFEGRR